MSEFTRVKPMNVPKNWRKEKEQFSNQLNEKIDGLLKDADDPLMLDKNRQDVTCS